MLIAYLLGMYCAWHRIPLVVVMLFMILSTAVIYIFMFRVRKPYINRQDYFLWYLPLLLFLGFLIMQEQMVRPEIESAFEEKAECTLTGKISMIVDKKGGRVFYVKDNYIYLSRGEPYLCENVIVQCSDDKKYQVGNSITVYGKIQKFSKATNLGQFNSQLYYQIENIDYQVKAEVIEIIDASYSKFHAILYNFKQKLVRVYDTILSKKESGALTAMLLGEKQLLEDEIKQLYQQNGISHILAISGLHISLIGLSIYQLLKKLRCPIIVTTLLSIILIYCYGVLTNFSVSTNRSIVMFTVMLLSRIIGKTYDMLSATALSAFLILLTSPMQIFSAGFLLSFGAVLGLSVLIPCFQILFPTKNKFISSIYISIAAQAMTLPLVLIFFYQLPIYSVLINLIILPCVSILTITALLAGIFGVIYLPLGVFLVGGANYILRFYEWLCRLGSNLPGNLITLGKPDSLRVILYFILLILFVWASKHYGKKKVIAILIFALIVLVLPQKSIGVQVTMLDVGQGDGIYMQTETGKTFLIDGGSSDVSKVGTYRILPFLKASGVSEIDYAIVTHSDQDHVSGLMELIQEEMIRINFLILPNIDAKDTSYLELEALANEKGIKVLYIEAGDVIQDHDVIITCLHPTPDFHVTTANAYSTVLSISYGEFDMLLTGDLEQDGEKLLLDLLQEKKLEQQYDQAVNKDFLLATDYDVLKVAHHGSKYSTCENFLEIVKPEYALISCGKNNGYGHPHAELLDRLNHMNSNVYITSKTGAITIHTDGKKIEIDEFVN